VGITAYGMLLSDPFPGTGFCCWFFTPSYCISPCSQGLGSGPFTDGGLLFRVQRSPGGFGACPDSRWQLTWDSLLLCSPPLIRISLTVQKPYYLSLPGESAGISKALWTWSPSPCLELALGSGSLSLFVSSLLACSGGALVLDRIPQGLSTVLGIQSDMTGSTLQEF